MFERYIKLSEARQALRRGRLDEAARAASDPLVRDQRRARDIRAQALDGLLARAQWRRQQGTISAALADLSQVLAFDPQSEEALTLKRELTAEMERAATAERSARATLREIRRLTEAGELEAADQLVNAVPRAGATAVELDAAQALLGQRQNAARELAKGGRAALAQRNTNAARDLLRQAQGLWRRFPERDALAHDVAVARVQELLPELRRLQLAGEEAAAREIILRERVGITELEAVPELRSLFRDAAVARVARLNALLEQGELERAVAWFAQMEPALRQGPGMASIAAVLEDLSHGLDLIDRGGFAAGIECLRRAASAGGWAAIAQRVEAMAVEERMSAKSMAEARALAASGQMLEARQLLTELLQRWPLHDDARRELEILDQGTADRDRRLGEARALAKEGRLRQASALALALVVPGTEGEEARLLISELQARMDLVSRGLDQVRRSVHTRDSASMDGLRHCLLRLEQLAKLQSDSEEIATLQRGVRAEIRGLDRLQEAAVGLEQGDPAVVKAAVADLAAAIADLIRPDRLDARVLDVADAIAALAETATAQARLESAGRWLEVLAPLAQRFPRVRERLEALAEQVSRGREVAAAAVKRGEQALAARDVDDADAHLAAARSASVDGVATLRLERALLQLRAQRTLVQEATELATRDVGAAQQRLGELPHTPPMLRTRIFDLKQSLARAQGLDSGFLLRVDEGGEYLVLRSDSITIGNVRENKADLALLANLAGHHAVLERKMSFHGGMEDSIRADKGQIFIRGSLVGQHRLSDGDRVRLGSSLELWYRQPTSRSLTVSLTILGGFQVLGTDKVLLMKDRGRDGRILIGNGPDVHVRVPFAQPEIELFATREGQVKVRFESGGEINGRPFSGEHPVVAGTVVKCGLATFVLQPWARGQ